MDFNPSPTVQIFNYVIATVHLKNRWPYLDPTRDICTVLYLPYSDRAKSVLLILGNKEQPDIRTTTDPFDPIQALLKDANAMIVTKPAG